MDFFLNRLANTLKNSKEIWLRKIKEMHIRNGGCYYCWPTDIHFQLWTDYPQTYEEIVRNALNTRCPISKKEKDCDEVLGSIKVVVR